MDRRTFIERAVRGGLLAALALSAGILVGRGQLHEGSKCALNGMCRDCRILDGCGLPQAEKERKRQKR